MGGKWLWRVVLLLLLHHALADVQPYQAPPLNELPFSEVLATVAQPYVPECRRRIAFIDTKQNGLSAQILRVLDIYAIARLFKASVNIAVQRYWNYGCGHWKTWECYFSSPNVECRRPNGRYKDLVTLSEVPKHCVEMNCDMINNPPPEIPDCLKVSLNSTEWCIFEHVEGGFRDLHPIDFQLRKELARQIWQPRPEIHNGVQTIMENIELVNTTYTGVHIRRGDKALEVELPDLSLYAEAITLLAPKGSIVFAASDDFEAIKDLANLLPEHRVISLSRGNSGHVQRLRNRMNRNERYKTTAKLIAEIEVLSRADLFVGTFTSNVGKLVHLLRYKETTSSVSLDAAWVPGNAWRGFKSKYCDSKDANQEWCTYLRHRS